MDVLNCIDYNKVHINAEGFTIIEALMSKHY
jgi:hypothetical protein